MPPEHGGTLEEHGSGAADRRTGRLAAITGVRGERVVSAANRPVRLDEPERVWLVERGALDVFLVRVRDGTAEAPFHHVLRLETGRLAFGAAGTEELRVVAKGLPGTILRRMSAADLTRGTGAGADSVRRALAAHADHWIGGFVSALAAQVEPRPRPEVLLAEGVRSGVSGVVASAAGVVWVQGGAALLFGTEDPREGELVPLAPGGWATLHEPARITVRPSHALGSETLLSRALPGFHRLAFAAELFNRQLALVDQANLQVARSAWRRRDEDEARGRLYRLLVPAAPAASSGAALMAALRAIGRHERIAIREPAGLPGEPPALAAVLRASGVRARRVRLSPGERWWRGDSGAIVAFRRDGGAPVALLPGATGRYRRYDPQTGGTSPIRRSDAAELADHGYVLYARLPEGGPVGLGTLLATAAGRFGADLARVVAAGCMAAVLALAPAAGIGVLVDRVIPSSDHRALLQLAALLVLLAFAGALAHVLRGTAVMRIEARFAARAGAALWDRLLRLPIRFHREYSSGELSTRALAFQTVRDRLSGAAGAALLSALFLVPSICLVLVYDAVLGAVSLGIGIIALAVTVVLGAAQLAPGRRRFREERLLAGRMSQFIDCIRKLQAAGAEQSARAWWARRYRAQKLAEMRVGVLDEHLKAFSAAVPLLAAAALLAVSAARQDGALGVGAFVVVYVGSMIFYAAIIALGGAFEAVASVIPACEQILPVLAATPEDGGGQGPPVVLGGGLRFDSVSFRYGDAGPPVLDRVTWYAEPGEFVAIVGESGAGKSTLVRVALGLETPTGGAVYYDDRDLAHLDRASVRRQIGVVLQDGGSHVGTVLDNIIGLDQALNVDDAWRAARLAAVDRDIAAMPMQMHTGMGERAAVVSGGQSQRIRIAAALVRNPRIVFLDEATNWLDRTNQAAVMEGIRKSTATRIVIAHRMSTIRAAHRIYVLEAGRVVQVGRFDELAGTDGPFRDLVRRQMP